MNHTIIHMGESKEAWFRDAFKEYQKRMNAFGGLEDIALKPAKTPGRELSSDEIALALEKEAAEFEKLLSMPKYQKSYKIALCIEGKTLSSEGLAQLFEKVAGGGNSQKTTPWAVSVLDKFIEQQQGRRGRGVESLLG